ncbi:11L [Yaba monkey tumor virus]|uniref:11L n=1 Tax=Yaba monkey tumor virus (strain VR587) TaxID=928314 RepID=Q6TUZ9_YMTV5|nr:ankyrin repeat protein [Yaba monkey tumor virus]AAR07370.1 11L [Yaba monkey tumor virus]
MFVMPIFYVESGIKDYFSYPLHSAIYFLRDEKKVKHILKQGCDINQKADNSLTPLHYAVLTDNVEIVKLLLLKGVDVNATDRYGCSPLYYYIMTKKENYKIIKLLLDNGTDVNAVSSTRENLLHAFTEYGCRDTDVLKNIIKKTYDINLKNKWGKTPLSFAMEKDNMYVIKLLLQNGADPFTVSDNMDTLMHCFLNNRNLFQKVKLLLDIGLNPNSKNVDGDSPLHKICSVNPNLETVSLLVSKGADVNTINNDGNTPLHVYMYEYPDKFCKNIFIFLLDSGADININNKYSKQPFNILSCNREITINLIEIFIKKNVHVDNKNVYGYSPIHNLSNNPNINIVKRWLDYGANPNDKTVNGVTPTHISAKNKNTDVFKLIISKGGDVNAVDRFGNTPLHESVLNVSNLRYLISLGVKDVPNKRGETALFKAVKHNKLDSVKCLLQQSNNFLNYVTDDGNTCISECFNSLNEIIFNELIINKPDISTMIISLNNVNRSCNNLMLKKSIMYMLLLDSSFYVNDKRYICMYKFINECIREINVIKNVKIGYRNYSIFNILKNYNINLAVDYIDNSYLYNFVTLKHYGQSIKDIIERALYRKSLILDKIKKMDSICKNTHWFFIPMEIKLKIIKNIEDRYLE